MNEQQLKDFGAFAETVVELPDFEELNRTGRHRRARRSIGIAAALALVLAVAGATLAQNRDSRADLGPVGPPSPSPIGDPAGTRYPGATMTDLDPGLYWLQSCCISGHSIADYSDNPIVDFEVPRGWNAWVGPNRFNGHAPGRSNEEALGHMTWYVGALVLEVKAVNTHGCGNPDAEGLTTADDLVAALRRTFAFREIQGPVPDDRFGYPATRMRVRVTKAIDACPDSTSVFDTTSFGQIQYAGSGWIADIWVVDVNGYPIYVQQIWSPRAPHAARRELDSIIRSIRFSFAPAAAR